MQPYLAALEIRISSKRFQFGSPVNQARPIVSDDLIDRMTILNKIIDGFEVACLESLAR